MNLADYISDMGRRKALATACGTSPEYLWQVANEWNGRKASHSLARLIEEKTEGLISRHSIRPDIFGPPDTEAANDA